MKSRSTKTAARIAASDAGRMALRARIKGCEYCGVPNFALHEIPRGGLRTYILDNPACILGLCDPGCHQLVARWEKPKQLALLWIVRQPDFNLTEYNRWAIAKVHWDDVEPHVDGLISELGHEGI